MIEMRIKDNKISINLRNVSGSLFNKIIAKLKYEGCQYEDKLWYCSVFKYNDVLAALEELDIIDSNVTEEFVASYSKMPKEQETSKVRRIPDYSLMTFPPIAGKDPNQDFQKVAISKGINRSRYAFFYEMGTGKSYIASSIIAHRYLKYKECSKVIFLTSAIGVRNLKNEICKFIKGLDSNKIYIATGKNIMPFDSDCDIVISSYGTFRRICLHYKKVLNITAANPKKPYLPLKEWSKGNEMMLILDESHEVAHSESQQSKMVLLHSTLFKFRYLFTGTPADKPEKLYNQFRILDPWLVWGLSFNDWKNKMAEMGTYFSPYAIREWKKDQLEEQNTRFINSHGEYLKAEDVIDLPDGEIKKLKLTMTKKHREIYNAFLTAKMPKKGSVKDIVNMFPYLMQSVDNPKMLDKHRDELSDLNPGLVNSIDRFKVDDMEKFNCLDDIIESHPDEKILVWAIHPMTIKMIEERYAKLKPITILGKTDKDKRNDLINEFRLGESKLLVANIMTLNSSVTMTECHIQVYFERGFNFTIYEQSTKRIHRLGQMNKTLTYILIYDDSLDMFLDKNLDDKGLLTKKLVDKGFLSQEEWNKVFTCYEDDRF